MAGIRGFFLRFGSLRWFEASVAGVLLGMALAAFLPLTASAQVVVQGAPSWAGTPANLVYAPQAGTSKVAYVHPTTGSDSLGEVWTYTSGNVLFNPAGKRPFLTVAAARAAINDHQGPHAVLIAAGPGVAPYRGSIEAAAKGENSSQPFLIGAYYPGGAVPSTRAERQAVIDPGPGNADTAVVYHAIAGPWTAEGGGVFSVNIGAGESDFKGVRVTHNGAATHLSTDTGTPDPGECVYDGGTGELLVRLAGDTNPAARTVHWRENNCGNIVTIVSGSGFGNLILQNLRVTTSFRMVGGSSYDGYDATAAVQPENGWGALFMYGGTDDVVLFDGCDFAGTAEGVVVQGVDKTDADRIEYFTINNCVIYNVWAEGGTQEGLYCENTYRARVHNSFVVANGWNIKDPVLGPGDTAQGRCHGMYWSFSEAPWLDNCVVALNSNSGSQMRCGGFVTRSVFYANADNLPFGHGSNDYENRLWRYEASVCDSLIWGTKPVGGTNYNGRGLGWGRCDTLSAVRLLVVGEDTRRANNAAGSTYGINIGTTPGTSSGGGTITVGAVSVGPAVVFDWNYGAAGSAGTAASLSFQSGASTGASSVTIAGLRVYERARSVCNSEGTEGTTRAQWDAVKMHLCRFDVGGTAALYGPSGRVPRSIAGGGVLGYISRPGSAERPLHTRLGFGGEEAMVTAWANGDAGVNAVRVLNTVRPWYGYALVRGGSAGLVGN